MTRFIEWIISLLIVIALFVVIGLFLPSTRTVAHTVQTNRPMATVNDLFSGFTRFKDWNTLVNRDPRVRFTTSGPEFGEGARLEFNSNDSVIGSGSWQLEEYVPGERIVYAVQDRRMGENKRMAFRFERTGQRNQNVEITQRFTVDYGWNLFGRYAGLLFFRDSGDEIKAGLSKVSNLLAAIPRFDYSQHEPGFEVVNLPAVNALQVTTAAKRANDEIAVAMTNQLKWIEQVMEKNDLEPAGAMRIVTNEFTTETYGFDIVMPIRREGTGPEEGEEATDEEAETEADASADSDGEAEDEATPRIARAMRGVDPAAPVEPLEVLDIDLESTVVYVQIPAMQAAKTAYIGPSPGLPRVRDLLRAWSMVRALDISDRPYEEYLVPIRNMLAEDAGFAVYWPIRGADGVPVVPTVISPVPGTQTGAGDGDAGQAEADDAEAPDEAAQAE